MAKQSYTELLRDPRWQRKRLEIMERDNFTCQECQDNESTLVVHHFFYESGKYPWDYPNESLITLCEECHADQRDRRPEIEHALLETIRDFFTDDIECFTEALTLGLVKVDQSYPGVTRALERVAGWEKRRIQAFTDEYRKKKQELETLPTTSSSSVCGKQSKTKVEPSTDDVSACGKHVEKSADSLRRKRGKQRVPKAHNG